MAGEGFVAAEAGARDYGGGVTFSVVVTCLMAASCGLIYGYESTTMASQLGGVTQMESFLSDFFLDVLSGTKNTNRGVYWKYDNQWPTVFTSSLFIASALSSVVASHVTRRVGRQAIKLFGSALFLAGAIINAGAVHNSMIIIGRMLRGFGIGFTFQSAPVYLSETAPAKWRGAFASAYNAFCVIDTLFATVTNYFTDRIPGWGWRVSLGLGAVPGALIALGAFFVSDTPSSLVLRGHHVKARAALQRICGADAYVESELKDIVRAVEEADGNDEGAFRRLFSRQYRQYLVVGVAMPALYELTGVSVISVFLPVVFRTVGFSTQKAILGSVINFSVNLVATLVSTFVMDHTGGRFLLIVGGLSVTLCKVAISWIMAAHLGTEAAATMPRSYTVVVFLFHAGWFLVATVCAAAFMPETKGVPLELMRSVWTRHWYWRRFADKDDKQDSQDNRL